MIRGTVVTQRRRCGKPNCHCTDEGAARIDRLSYAEAGRSRTVPRIIRGSPLACCPAAVLSWRPRAKPGCARWSIGDWVGRGLDCSTHPMGRLVENAAHPLGARRSSSLGRVRDSRIEFAWQAHSKQRRFAGHRKGWTTSTADLLEGLRYSGVDVSLVDRSVPDRRAVLRRRAHRARGGRSRSCSLAITSAAWSASCGSRRRTRRGPTQRSPARCRDRPCRSRPGARPRSRSRSRCSGSIELITCIAWTLPIR